MADTDIVQVIAEARVDAKSLSEFVFKPANFMVSRRLAPPVNTLQYYIDSFGDVAINASRDVVTAINKAVILSGFIIVDSFELGANITERNQVLRHTATGKLYRWAGNLPKTVPVSSTPTSSGGFGTNAWIEVSDTALRQDLGFKGGAKLVRDAMITASSVEDMISYTGVDGRGFELLNYYADAIGGGGTFYYDATMQKTNHDGGSVISPTVPFTKVRSTYISKTGETDITGRGCFVRAPTNKSCDILEYGARADSLDFGFSSTACFNAALKKYAKVTADGGRYNLSSCIRIPNNRTLYLGSECELYLLAGANDYLITNDDLAGGNSNINIIGKGAKLYGNKILQSTKLTAGVAATDRSIYCGFGLWLPNVKGLVVSGIKIIETQTWGIGYWNVDGAVFKDIKFEQTTEEGKNGDGITGHGSNIVIENISGYTNDDMVYIGSGGGVVRYYDMLMPQTSIKNIYINNIKGDFSESGTDLTGQGVRASGRRGTTISNIHINNVHGMFRYCTVECANFWTPANDGEGGVYDLTFENLKITNCSRVSNNRSQDSTRPISLKKALFKDVLIDNVNIREANSNKMGGVAIEVGAGSYVNTMTVSNCFMGVYLESYSTCSVLTLRSTVDNLIMTGCMADAKRPSGGDTVGVLTPVILSYLGDSTPIPTKTTHAILSGCRASSLNPDSHVRNVRIDSALPTLSITGDCVIVPSLSGIKGVSGDTVRLATDGKRYYFQDGAWKTLALTP